jgi:hypothetical protein
VLAAILLVRFARTNGMAMFRMMNEPMDEHAAHDGDGAGTGEADGGYTCPMHPEVHSSRPGRCPKCGMDLEPAATVSEHGHHDHH